MAERAPQGWYAAFKAKDTRFDGRFFVGVSSTGIYCRPVCRARLPREENCTWYPTAAAAEQAGYRPCLVCRPELAPGASATDASAGLARRAAHLLEEGCGSGLSLPALAGRLGCTDRHLRRVFAAAYGVSPVQYLQTCRLLLAKSLLTDTGLPVLEVAMAAGFGSLRRFNALFQKQYRLSPTALRRRASGPHPDGDEGRPEGVTLALGYRPPYPWRQVLGVLAARAIPGVETVTLPGPRAGEGEYLRAARLDAGAGRQVRGWLRVASPPGRDQLAVTVSASLLPALPQVLARVRRLFDLACDPDAIYEALSPMNDLGPGLCRKGTRLPGAFDPFEAAVAAALGPEGAGALAAALGAPLEGGIPGIAHAFPAPGEVLAAGALPDFAAGAETVRALSRALVRGDVTLDAPIRPEEEMEKLAALPGVGEEMARRIALVAMGWPDAFPANDAGLGRALPGRTPGELAALAEGWRPWRGYAAHNLWNALGGK